MKKYELTSETTKTNRKTLHRIRALIGFDNVRKGDLGGWIEKEDNLSQKGDAWVYDDAQVSGNAFVSGNARVYGNARISNNALVYDNARIFNNARVCDNAWVCGNAWVLDNAWISDNAWIRENAWISNDAWIRDNAWILGNVRVSDNAQVFGDAQIFGNAYIYGCVQIGDKAYISSNNDYTYNQNYGSMNRATIAFRNKNGDISVRCGCFSGTLDEFEKKVVETHKGTKYNAEYLAMITLFKIKFGIDSNTFKNLD